MLKLTSVISFFTLSFSVSRGLGESTFSTENYRQTQKLLLSYETAFLTTRMPHCSWDTDKNQISLSPPEDKLSISNYKRRKMTLERLILEAGDTIELHTYLEF